MPDPLTLIRTLEQLDIKLSVRQGKLIADAPKGALSPILSAQVKAHKQTLKDLLEHDPVSDVGWVMLWRERIQTQLQAREDWVWADEYMLMRTANNGPPKARGQAREKLLKWYMFMLERREVTA